MAILFNSTELASKNMPLVMNTQENPIFYFH